MSAKQHQIHGDEQSFGDIRRNLVNLALALESRDQRWRFIDAVAYRTTPAYETYDGSTYTVATAWAAAHAYAVGLFIKPNTANGFIYENVAIAGTGTSAGAEPTWGTTLGADTIDNAGANQITWRCRGLHVLKTLADLSAIMSAGDPLKYFVGETYFYGRVMNVTSKRIAIQGAPLNSLKPLNGLYVGLPELAVVLRHVIPGAYDGAVRDLLIPVGLQSCRWLQAPGYLVYFECRNVTTSDTGTKPKINVKVGGNLISVNNANLGVQMVNASYQSNSPVAINVANYKITDEVDYDIRCTAAGGVGDADDLVVHSVFVLE